MYVTRFGINPARRGARHLLASQQRMHAAVLAGFPPQPGAARPLWRVDSGEHRTDLYIVSEVRPDLTHLVEQAGWPTASTWETVDYEPFLARLDVGQRWAFRLTANPVRSIPGETGSRGRVSAHVTVAQQQEWLLERADRRGFRIPVSADGAPDVVVHGRRTARFARREGDSKHTVTIAMATFNGSLDVVDPDRLRTTLRSGVGRAKAYGCGLLTLARN